MILRSKIVLPLLVVLALAGLGLWVYQIQQGLIVTNMRNSFLWGLYIAMWAFFVGTAAGGLVVTSSVYLFKIEGLKPISRIASVTAFICTVAAMGMLLPDLGRIERVFNLVLHPNFTSVLPWDFIVLSGYAILAAIYTYILMRPDIVRRGIHLPLLGRVGKKNIGETELEQMNKKSERLARYIAPLALVLAILIHTVTAWVLATQLARPWWFGGALAPMFVATAVATGPVVVILAALYTLRHKKSLMSAYGILAKIAVFGAVVLLFIYYGDFVVRYWWGAGAEFETLRVLFSAFWPLYLLEALFIIAAIIIFLKRAKQVFGLIAGSLCMVFGVLAHRFVLFAPAFNVIPFKVTSPSEEGLVDWVYPIASGEIQGTLDNPEPLFVSWWNYVPSPVEFTVVIGVVAAVILIYVGLSKILPLSVETK
jgi:molybdopterin-containing oxidoreductase family membrane subunit